MGAKQLPSLENARGYYHGEAALGYERKRVKKRKWQVEQALFQSLLKGMQGRVLDMPVGTGRFLGLYRQFGLEVVGVDSSNAMLDQARIAHPWAALEQGDATGLRFGNGEFNVAVCVRLLHLVATHEVTSIMNELFRVASDHVVLTTYLTGESFVQGRSQVHRYYNPVWDQPGWPAPRRYLLVEEKGTPYYMLHYKR